MTSDCHVNNYINHHHSYPQHPHAYLAVSELLTRTLMIIALWILRPRTCEHCENQSKGQPLKEGLTVLIFIGLNIVLENLEEAADTMEDETKPKRPVTPTGNDGMSHTGTSDMTSIYIESLGGTRHGESSGQAESSGASCASGGARPKTQLPSSQLERTCPTDIADKSLVSQGKVRSSSSSSSSSSQGKGTGNKLRDEMLLLPHIPQESGLEQTDNSKKKKKEIASKEKTIKMSYKAHPDPAFSTNAQSALFSPVVVAQSPTTSAAQVFPSYSSSTLRSSIATMSLSSSSGLDLREDEQGSSGTGQHQGIGPQPRITPDRRVLSLEGVLMVLEIFLGPDTNATVKNWKNLGSMYGVHHQEMAYYANCAPETKVRKLFGLPEFLNYTVQKLVADLQKLNRTDVFEMLRKHGIDC